MKNNKIKIETVLKKKIFYNSDNGYTVFEDDQGRVFRGYLINNPEQLKNITLLIECKKTKTKYGIQYQIEEIRYKIPALYHFLTGVVKGVQKKAAIEIAEKYKNIQTLEHILKTNEKELLKIKGIGPKSLEKLKKGIKTERDLYELAEILLPYGISSNIIKKIYAKYKNNSVIQKLKENPYYVLTSVRGIGFKKADNIALKAKLADKSSIYRAKAAIIYVMEQILSEEGESVFNKNGIKEKFYELISEEDLDTAKFEEAFNLLQKEGKIIEIDRNKQEYSFDFAHYIELNIFNFVKEESFQFLYKDEKIFMENFIQNYENENKIKLDENQKKAVIEFLTNDSPLYIIAGYAGTGKTTTSKALVEFLKRKNKKIVGCALSGAAANRLKSVADIPSFTIHSLLKYQRGKGTEESIYEDMFKYNSSNKLDYDLIILDEASMVSASLFYHLVKAIDPKRTKILILGDDAQLPPVGWGEVFADLLEYDEVPKTKLTKIYRQSEDKVITLFAGEIRKGYVPKDFKENKFSDFQFIPINISFKLSELPSDKKRQLREENNIKIRNYILKGFSTYKDDIIKSLYKYMETGKTDYLREYLSRIQLITATKNGILGTYEMNIAIKNILNPINRYGREGEDFILIRNKNNVNKYFSVYDKIIHLKNQDMFCTDERITDANEIEDKIYCNNERVYNGQTGIITNILPFYNEGQIENSFIEVFYPNENYYTYYEKNDFFEEIIDLSYSITIHKSQGQEYKSVIIPVTFSHFVMLNAKLMYTAITRAKDRVKLVGETGAFAVACKKLNEIKRNTNLKYIIREEMKEKKLNVKEIFNEKDISDNDILPF